MSTTGSISLEHPYFRVHAGTTAGSRDAGEEMRHIERWREKHGPAMEAIRDTLQGSIESIRRDLGLPLVPYSPEALRVRTTSFGEAKYIEFHVRDNDPSGARNILECEGAVPCRYTMRFPDVRGIDEVFVDVYFSALPEEGARARLKETLARLLRLPPARLL